MLNIIDLLYAVQATHLANNQEPKFMLHVPESSGDGDGDGVESSLGDDDSGAEGAAVGASAYASGSRGSKKVRTTVSTRETDLCPTIPFVGLCLNTTATAVPTTPPSREAPFCTAWPSSGTKGGIHMAYFDPSCLWWAL